MDTLNNLIKLARLGKDREYHYELDQSQDWVNDLLYELNETVVETELNEMPDNGKLNIEVTLKKQSNHQLREHLIIRGNIKGNFYTHCVRCLEVMKDNVDLHFDACAIPSDFEQNEHFEDQDIVICNNEEMDLYFYENGQVNLKEIIHEQIYLDFNQIPIHNENCQGLCQVCGANLNKGSCKHQQKH